MLLERMEMLPAALTAVPPPIFAASDLYFGVSLSASASLRRRVGGIFIVGFEAKKSIRRRTDPEVGPMAWYGYQAVPWALLWPPGSFRRFFLLPDLLVMEKYLGKNPSTLLLRVGL